MFTPSRDEARRFLIDSWRKHRSGTTLGALEELVAQTIAMHPEYWPVFDQPERYAERDYLPEFGETNPFLHVSMHLSIREQLSIDQPQGIRAFYDTLCQHSGDGHRAEHEIMDCLGEMLWQAQRSGSLPDPAIYFACLQAKIGAGDSAALPSLPPISPQ